MIDFLILDQDIISIIFDIRTNNLVLEINELYNKIKKLEILLRYLSIDKDLYTCKNYKRWSRDDIYIISYDCVYYCMFNYLYNRLDGNIIFINNYNINKEDKICNYYESKILINPTYFEILVEFNKSVKIIRYQIYNIFLEGLQKLDKNRLNEEYEIKCKKDIKYYKFLTGI